MLDFLQSRSLGRTERAVVAMKRGHRDTDQEERVARRRFIKLGLAAMASTLLPVAALADDDWIRVSSGTVAPPARGPSHIRFVGRAASVRELAFYNVHTDERLNTAYWEQGSYIPGALHEVNHLFRDFRANEVKPIDPRLLDVLFAIRRELGVGRPIDLISGYRSYATNAWLASQSEGVARHSMHVEGKASDIHIPGIELRDLQVAALRLGAGGVGYYPRSGFVHVDTGRVRRW